MATSGTVNTSKTSDGYRYASLSWTQTSSGNVSTISWTAYIKDTRTSNNEWYMTSDVSFTVSCSKGTSSISSKTIMGSTRVEQRPGQIGSGSFKITHNSDGEAKFTIALSAAIYTVAVTNTGSGTWTLPTLISACSAPTSVTLTPAIVAPGKPITIKWSGAKGGNNNTISGYQVYYRIGSAPTKSASDSNKSVASSVSSTTFTIPSSATRGSKVYAGVVTKGSAGSTYYSGIKTSSAIAINKLPAAPTVSMPGTISALSTQVTASSILAGSDTDGQSYSVYYSVDSSSDLSVVPSDGIFAFDDSSNFHTYHFYTYDGLEYSSSTDRTITKNTIPTGNFVGTTPSLINFGGSYGATDPCDGYADSFSPTVIDSNKFSGSLKLKYRLLYSYTPNDNNSWETIEGELSSSLYTYDHEPIFQINIYSLLGLTQVSYPCSWKIRLSLYDGIDESTTSIMVPTTASHYYTIPGVPIVAGSYNQFADENITGSNSSKMYRRVRAIFTRDDSLTTYEVKTTATISGTSSDIANTIIAQGTKDESKYYLDIELSEGQPADSVINFTITGKNSSIKKVLQNISKTVCKTLPTITGIASLNRKIFSPFSTPSKIEISLTNPFSDQTTETFRSAYEIGSNGIILQVSRGTYTEETPLSEEEINNTILKFTSSETALFDVKKISSSNQTVLGLGVQNLQGTYACTARLKIQNLYGAVVYSENFKCGNPSESQDDFFTLNFNQAGTCSIPTINSNQIKYRYSAQGTDSSFTTSKYIQERMYLTIPVTYSGYTVESTTVSLSLFSGSTTYAVKSVTFDSAIPSISSSGVSQYTITSNITLEDIGELDVSKLGYNLKVMGSAGAIASSESIQRAEASSSDYFNSIPFITSTVELNECTFTNEEDYTLNFRFNYVSDGLPSSTMSGVTVDKKGYLVDSDDPSVLIGTTSVSWPSVSDGTGTLQCDSSYKGWDYKNLTFKMVTEVENDGHTISKTILSNNLLVFHGRPLVAYRKKYLGINTSSPESGSLLDIHAMADANAVNDHSKIYLQDEANEKKWTIDVTNGTITFASESVEQWRLPYVAGNGIAISSGEISLAPVAAGGTSFAPGSQAPSFGGTFNIPNISFDSYGRVASLTNTTVMIPNTVATASAAGLMSTVDKEKLDALFYKSGDKLTIDGTGTGGAPFTGYVTSSTTVLRFMVPVGKSLANITTITCNDCTGGIRGISGYVDGSRDSTNWTSGYTIICTKATDHIVQVQIEKSSAFSNVKNNTPIAYAAASFELEFS